MRPKIVAVTLVLATVVVVTLALLVKGIAPGPVSPTAGSPTTAATPEIAASGGKGAAVTGEQGAPAPAPGSPATSSETSGNVAEPPPASGSPGNKSVIAKTFEQERAARIQGDLSQINEAVVTGKDDPAAANAVLDRITSPDPEVRQAAMLAVVYFDDPATIARLKEILGKTEDPREKVAIMDALELMTPAPDPFEGMTNAVLESSPPQRPLATTNAAGRRPSGVPSRPPRAPIPPAR